MSFFLIAFNIESINGIMDEIPDEMDTLMFINHSIPITRHIDQPAVPASEISN